VDITVNGKAVPFNMKIGEAGEAFFVFETDGDIPDDLITSPLLEPTEPVSPDPLPLEDIGRFGARGHRGVLTDDRIPQEPDFFDLDAPSTSLSEEAPKESASASPPDSPGDSFQRVRNTSSFVHTGNGAMPISVESDKDVPQEVHSNLEKLNDEAHPWPYLDDPPATHGNGTGGMSRCTFTQWSCDSK
jgi:phosphatidate phosphatase PAH1